MSFQNKEYIIGKNNIDEGEENNSQTDNAELHALKENVEQLERTLAAQYLVDYADLFQLIPTVGTNDVKLILTVIDTWKKYRNVVSSNPELIQAMVKDLESKLQRANEMAHQFEESGQQNHAELMDLTALKDTGANIAEDVENLATKKFGPQVISSTMALANCLRVTIDCLKIQVSVRFERTNTHRVH